MHLYLLPALKNLLPIFSKICYTDKKLVPSPLIVERMFFVTTIEEIAQLTAQRKLLPFLGAGCSKAMLNCDWDSLIQDMRSCIRTAAEGHLAIAQAYVDEHGKAGLCEFLRPRLYTDHFDEEKGGSHIAVMCSGAHVIYTTNQDNVMELCMEHFGRKFCKVVQLDDLTAAYPDECLYIKFHGDLDHPDSVVFTEEDYRRRTGQSDCFLDIRLRSDLLGRQLLFLGYSFRDPNIQQMFRELQHIAGGRLPPSYLVAYAADEAFTQQCKAYNIEVIIPQVLFSGTSEQEAFETFLGEWNRLTFEKYSLDAIHSFFSPHREVCIRMLSQSECAMLEKTLSDMPLPEAVRKFRGIVDAANIPDSLQERVANLFFALCRRCETEEVAAELNGASFNLHLKTPNLVYMQAAHVLALANVYEEQDGLSLYYVSMPNGFPKEVGVLIGAISIDLLTQWGRLPRKYFLQALAHTADYSEQYDSFGEEATQFCVQQYNYAWAQCKTTLENPLHRQKRLNCPLHQFVSTDFRKISSDLMRAFPIEFK